MKANVGFEVRYSNVILLNTAFIAYYYGKMKEDVLFRDILNDFNLKQCFFGEHLLSVYPSSIVAIVESEKTAIIAALMLPEYVWLAAGNLNGLCLEKCQVLENRTIIVYPDQGAFEKWNIRAQEMKQYLNADIFVSNVLCELFSFDVLGCDIADYLIGNMPRV